MRTGIVQQASTSGPRRIRTGLGMAALALALGAIWHGASTTQALPTPVATIRVLGQALAAGALYAHIIATLLPALYGFGLACLAGGVAGAILGASPYWRRVWEPVVAGLNAVPKITLFPLFILLFGVGIEARVVIAFVHAVFPILITVMTGVKELNPVYTKLARTTQAGPVQIMTKIYLPALAPGLATATRLSMSLALIGVVLSETFAAKHGLGYLIMDAYAAYRLDQMFAVIGLLYAIALTLTLLPAHALARRKRHTATRPRRWRWRICASDMVSG